MPFTSSHAATYHDRGWVTVPDFFDPMEVEAMRGELERLLAEGRLRNVATDGDGRTTSTTHANLQICPLSPVSPFFRALPYAAKVREAVSALVGEPVTFWLDQIFCKPGGHGAGTGWHQDNAYFKADRPLLGVGMWTALHEATIANGTMHIIPRTGLVLPHERDGGSDHHIRCEVDESQAIAIELPAGGSLFFAYDIPHCTRANTTDQPRAGLALHFAHASQQAYTDNHRYRNAPVITGPGADDGTATWGERLIGTWEERFACGQAV